MRAPVTRVFDLARSVDIHAASMAHTGERAVAGVTAGLMELGDTVTWRARHFGVWQHLTTQITALQRPVHFRDTLLRGAFARFDHDHCFASLGDGTLMTDVFDYTSPLVPLGWIADRLFLARYMTSLLNARNATIQSVAESDAWRGFVLGDMECGSHAAALPARKLAFRGRRRPAKVHFKLGASCPSTSSGRTDRLSRSP